MCFINGSFTDVSGILPEVSVDPMKVIEDAVLEFSDKKEVFVAYMSSMLVRDQGMLLCISYILYFIPL